MRDFTSKEFLDWFFDKIHHQSQLDLLNEMVGVMSRHSGEKVAFTVFVKPNLPRRVIARVVVGDQKTQESLRLGLRYRTLQVRPACWFDGRSLVSGATCNVAGKVVTLIKGDDDLLFDVRFPNFDLVINADLLD